MAAAADQVSYFWSYVFDLIQNILELPIRDLDHPGANQRRPEKLRQPLETPRRVAEHSHGLVTISWNGWVRP